MHKYPSCSSSRSCFSVTLMCDICLWNSEMGILGGNSPVSSCMSCQVFWRLFIAWTRYESVMGVPLGQLKGQEEYELVPSGRVNGIGDIASPKTCARTRLCAKRRQERDSCGESGRSGMFLPGRGWLKPFLSSTAGARRTRFQPSASTDRSVPRSMTFCMPDWNFFGQTAQYRTVCAVRVAVRSDSIVWFETGKVETVESVERVR